jgi:septum formation protein
LVLASRSPRRRELLTAAGYRFTVWPPHEAVEGALAAAECAEKMVLRLAEAKAADVVAQGAEGVIIACDTVVECEGQILGKPLDQTDARRMLQLLAGREHRVLSGLCVWSVPEGRPQTRLAVTRLRMDQLTPAQLEEYLASGLWQGKAGAFGYQDRLGWVHVIEGSESNVVGLPLELLAEMLAARATTGGL